MLSDNSGYYVIQIYTGDIPHVLKYSFSSPTNQHYILNSMVDFAFGTLMISDTELFWITRTSTSPYNLVFIKLTFANTSAGWANQMSCSGSCNINYSWSLLSTDKSKFLILDRCWAQTSQRYMSLFRFLSTILIYNIDTLVDCRQVKRFSYRQSSNWNIYFSWFQTSNGAIVDNRYKSTTSWSNVYGSVLTGDNIVATLQCSPTYLLIYNITSDSFTFKSFSYYLYDVAIENGSNR